MFDDARTLDRIERALDSTPTCPACRAPTDIRERDGRLWLECSDHAASVRRTVSARGWRPPSPRIPRAIVLDLTDRAAA